jgi:GPH family glycoside/pentoside/hexuronide:cation symporter
MTLSNHPFLLLCGTVLFFASGFIMVAPLLLYVNIYYVFQGDRAAASTLIGVVGTVGALVSVMMLPIGGKISHRIGKRKTAFFALGMIILGRASQFVLITPALPYLQLVCILIYMPGLMLMWALIPAMIADVCDLDELEWGRRREASFSSIYQWLFKFGGTLAMTLGGLLLAATGATTDSATAALPPNVVFRLRVLLSSVPTFMGVCAFVCMWLYPLTKDHMRTVKEKLNARKENELCQAT